MPDETILWKSPAAAAESPLAGPAHEACRCLRSKEMYIHVDQPDWHIYNSHSGIFWCIHTQKALGPDGKAAEPEQCKPGRSCYETV